MIGSEHITIHRFASVYCMFSSCYGNSESLPETALNDFHRIHTVIFDELARLGSMNVDIGRLTQAVLSARGRALSPPQRDTRRPAL